MGFFNKNCVYGLRAILYVSSHGLHGEFVNIGEISRHLNISFHFLTKIFQQLSREGIVDSSRGPKGGVRLAKPATEIYLIDIVSILEGGDIFDRCILSFPACGERTPCPVHEFWKGAKEDIRTDFKRTNLAMLSEEILENRLRLNP